MTKGRMREPKETGKKRVEAAAAAPRWAAAKAEAKAAAADQAAAAARPWRSEELEEAAAGPAAIGSRKGSLESAEGWQ